MLILKKLKDELFLDEDESKYDSILVRYLNEAKSEVEKETGEEFTEITITEDGDIVDSEVDYSRFLLLYAEHKWYRRNFRGAFDNVDFSTVAKYVKAKQVFDNLEVVVEDVVCELQSEWDKLFGFRIERG